MASVDEAVETMKRAGVLIEHQRERFQELRDALAGMIGLIQMVRNRNDVSLELHKVLILNHRVVTAIEVLDKADAEPL